MQPFGTAWVGFVTGAIGIAIAPAAMAQASDQVLRTGQPVLGAEQQTCQSSFLEDGVSALCTIIPGSSCPVIQSSCRTYERQLFMGTGLGAIRPDRA